MQPRISAPCALALLVLGCTAGGDESDDADPVTSTTASDASGSSAMPVTTPPAPDPSPSDDSETVEEEPEPVRSPMPPTRPRPTMMADSGGANDQPVGGASGAAGLGGTSFGGTPGEAGQGGEPVAAGAGGSSGECEPDLECQPEAPNTGDYYADCVARINQFRACVCLPPLERNFEAEACMDQQAEYDSEQDSAHAGFSDDVCQPRGNSQNECPGWRNAEQVVEGCLQQMFDEGPGPEDPCEGQCYQEHGHFINMTDTRVTSVACGMYDGDDGFWAVQNFFR